MLCGLVGRVNNIGISFTAHISNKKSAITSKKKLGAVAKHNLRKYKSSDYSIDNVRILCGTSNLFNDVKNVYKDEFETALEEYNKKQKREDRRIDNYFEHVSNKDQDMAVEVIIQLGDKEFWENHKAQIECMDCIYNAILIKLQELVEGFKVANAVIHYDEASPHMHIVGVPVSEGFKKGLYKKVSKRSVFTQEVLTKVIQDELRIYAQKETIKYLGEEIRDKKQGRNHDLSVIEYKVFKENEKLEKIKQENYRLELDNEVLNQESTLNELRLELLYNELDEVVSKVSEAKEECIVVEKDIAIKKNEKERYEILCRNVQKDYDSIVAMSDKAIEKAKIASELYKDMLVSGEGERFYREEVIELRYENEKLKEEVKGLKEMLDKVCKFMKKVVIGGRNMLDVFKGKVENIEDGVTRRK